MELSLCLEMLFTDRPFIDRMKTASELGYRAVEFWDWRGKDLQAVAQTATETGLTIAAMSGNRQHSLIDPEQRRGLVEEMKETLEVARGLKCRNVMMLSDILEADGSVAPPRPLSAEEKTQSIIDGMRELLGMAKEAGVVLLLEPLNTELDHRGCFLSRSEQGAQIVQRIGDPSAALLYDIYHMSMMGEDVIAEIERHKVWIGYLHVADRPGRHEPGSGAIDYAGVSAFLKKIDYTGFIGMEFSPSGSDREAARAPREVFA
jgi:hydroxypyruvate isomerase